MATHHYPVLVWEDHAHIFNAALVEGWNAAATALTAEAAMKQLEEYVHWMQREGYYPPPSLENLKLTWFTIPVRPVYVDDKKLFSCDELFPLRVACVHGQKGDGMHVAAIPALDVRFHYHAADKLKPLVEHHVKEAMRHLTPRDVTRLLPPRVAVLTQITVREQHARATVVDGSSIPNLSAIAEPLGTQSVRKHLSKPWEREAEVADLVARLTKELANVLLIGPAGIGKTTLLAEAVRRIERSSTLDAAERVARADQDPATKNKYWITQAGRIIAGMRYLGQWEERCETVLEELSSCQGTLCFENLLDLLRLGGEGPADSIAAFILPYLQRGELHAVAECTPEEFDACRRLLPGFSDVFQILRIEPFSPAQSLRILQLAGAALEQNTSIAPERGTIELIHRLFSRFRPYDAFPGNATAFLRNLFEDARRYKLDEIRIADTIAAFVQKTGLPEAFLRDDKPLDARACAKFFEAQVIGQPSACDCATSLVTTFKAGLNDPGRPLAVLLFCGPTGVGKTELARAIARYLFGHGSDSEARLIRLDMSEYGDAFAAARLLGTAGEPSELIKTIRRQPFSVVLLDEIEKASPEVFDVLLGLFDEGRLTDPFGRVTWFRSAAVVLTSNLGAEKQSAAGFSSERTPQYQNEALTFFRPEFFNRIDEVVTFEPLSAETIEAITEKELRSIAQRDGFKEQGIELSWTPALVKQLSIVGFDKRYGARPLQRTIEREVVAKLSRLLVDVATHRGKYGRKLTLDVDPAGQVTVT